MLSADRDGVDFFLCLVATLRASTFWPPGDRDLRLPRLRETEEVALEATVCKPENTPNVGALLLLRRCERWVFMAILVADT
jgi:hypothetical protein